MVYIGLVPGAHEIYTGVILGQAMKYEMVVSLVARVD